MKLKNVFGVLFCLFTTVPMMAEDDVMITRDGSMTPVKVEKISSSQVSFIDLKHKKRGRLNAPTDFVYMIMKEKGNNIFFDEEGNQTTSPAVKFEKKDNVIFLNRGAMFVIYNPSVGKDEIKYQLKDKKKAPWETVKKCDVFMIRNSDGTNTLYNDSYQEKQEQLQQQKSTTMTSSTLTTPTTVTTPITSTPLLASSAAATSSTAVATGQQLVTANMDNTKFAPAPDMSPTDLEKAVNTVNPYLLYRKGSTAEYCYQRKGEQLTNSLSGVPTYLRQIVEDEKIVNGQLVTYIRQEAYNKKHEPSKGIPASFKEMLLPTEIDSSGTFHFTHNIAEDLFNLGKRQGYGLLIPGTLRPGSQLQCSTLHDVSKSVLGSSTKRETVYSNWQVVGEEQIQTPAGTFNCMKLTGKISQKYDRGNFFGQNITCWMARGIGIVKYERINESDKDKIPFIIYLNSIDIK